MKLDSIKQDDFAGTQVGNEHLCDVDIKDLGVEGAFNRHWRADSVQPQCADHRDIGAASEGFRDVRTLPPWSTRVAARHRQMDAEFVKKDEVFDLQAVLLGAERGALWRRSFGGEFRLFFRARPSACSPRQMVERLVATRAFFFISARSSASVASGVVATRLVNLRQVVLSE